jgi:hypothetical protein
MQEALRLPSMQWWLPSTPACSIEPRLSCCQWADRPIPTNNHAISDSESFYFFLLLCYGWNSVVEAMTKGFELSNTSKPLLDCTFFPWTPRLSVMKTVVWVHWNPIWRRYLGQLSGREYLPWLTAMTSQLLMMSFVCWLIERTSHPIRRGAYTTQTRIQWRNADNLRTEATLLNAYGGTWVPWQVPKCWSASGTQLQSSHHSQLQACQDLRLEQNISSNLTNGLSISNAGTDLSETLTVPSTRSGVGGPFVILVGAGGHAEVTR